MKGGRASLVVLLAAAFALAGCGRDGDELESAALAKPTPPSPNLRSLRGVQGMDVAILTLDACRADHAGTYGYPLPTTPTIDAIAAAPDAVIYRRHYVHGASTKPSTASLFTGLYTHQHGINRGVIQESVARLADGEGTQPAGEGYRSQTLNADALTLAELFQQEGFRTLGITKSAHLVPEYGFARGFDEYVSRREMSGDQKRVRKILEMIESTEGHYFAYIHLNACHHPFQDFERDPEFMAEFGFPYPERERQAAGVDFTTPDIKFAARKGELELTPEDVRFLNLVYDAQYRWVDRSMVAPFVEGLRRMGRYENTLLILTADHGEELYEHRGYAHGHSVMNEVTHVLMVVKFPDGMKPAEMPKEVEGLTTNLDLMPTFLTLFDRRIPDQLPGADLFRAEPGVPMQLLASGREWGVVTPEYKLVIEADGRERLFDLRADPGEQNAINTQQPERIAALEGFANRMLERPGGFAPMVKQAIEPELLESLRELGYVE